MEARNCAYAIFLSTLSTNSMPTRGTVRDAVAMAFHRYGGVPGCIAATAYVYGDSPWMAPRRMFWALALAREASRTAPVRIRCDRAWVYRRGRRGRRLHAHPTLHLIER